ncbi:amino acid ABC transporter substrate-binding protein [Phenylobacterium sp. LH3H17]|uniref:amino acid ABC transporter substrate-binding protein n=1 Tax=Phenylobacterium sp. LH3H17 TaxID=2903901 RepID=UPI0020C9E54A|nr:amino acid ABC transporter substrate-binding protein [Phenylobacterium sp. LH3H17]UTP37790.1 amino acid ABC transporter substrate-binding protein [Phenylobacterium sp. LH3H17]
MWKRLAAAVGSMFVLAGCGEGVQKAPTPAAPAPKAPGPAPAYKAKPSPTLAAIKTRGYLNCGVHPGLSGFAFRDDRGTWRGFDVDTCRAVAAATLGDAKAVRYLAVTAQDRFSALQGGQIDILSRNTSWTFARDTSLGLDFPAITYYDGQGFMVPKALSLSSADELTGARICVQSGTASEANLADYFRARGLKYTPVVVSSEADARTAYQAEKCDAFSADVAALASARSVMNSPGAHVILPTVISKEPLGPVVRQDDPVWTDIVRWTVYAVILAEEYGIDSKSAPEALKTSTDVRVRRLLGAQDAFGPMLGLPQDWAYQAIVQVGAYDEVFARNVGPDSGLRLERGHNALWNAAQPGLLYAPPIR